MNTGTLTVLETKLMRRKMAYVTYDGQCKDPCIDRDGWLRECRRLRGHADGVHASDYPFYSWGEQ